MSVDRTESVATFRFPPSAPCVCGWGAVVYHEALIDYFEGKVRTCTHCNEPIDWFDLLCRGADFVVATFAAVGATTSYFKIDLEPGETKEIDLTAYMDESDARVLFVNFIPHAVEGESIVHPVQLHANSRYRRRFTTIHLLGHGPQTAVKTEIAVSFAWIPKAKDDPSWESLVDAFEALYAEELNGMIVPANVAIESRVGRFLTEYIQSKTGLPKKKTRADYGYRLGVMLPLICSMLNLPDMPKRVRDELENLREQRNALGHSGLPREGKPIARAEATRMAVAAALGCTYVDFLRERIGLP